MKVGIYMTVNRSIEKDNLYRAVNQEWIDQAEIPDDKPSVGGFIELHDDVEELLMKDLSEMASGDFELTHDLQKEMVKFYVQASDYEARNQAGIKPVLPYLEKINDLKSLQDLADQAKEFELQGIATPWSLHVSSDFKDAQTYTLYLGVPSLLLPDTTYYQENNPTADLLLKAYRQVGEALFQMAGASSDQAARHMDRVIDLDAQMAPHQKSREESADYTALYHPRDMETVETYAKDFSFKAVVSDLVSEEVDQVIVTEPDFYDKFDELFNDENIEAVKSWMAFHTLMASGGILSEEIRQLTSQINNALMGTTQAPDADKAAYRLTESMYSQVLGDYYGKKYFGEKARADVKDMVYEMIEVYKNRLKNNPWISDETADKAVVKLDHMAVLVGFPDEIPSLFYDLKVDTDRGFFENYKTLKAIKIQENLDRWNKPVDRYEWGMSAATVNAYFRPTANLICFPAAILQAPFYDFDQSRSQNYGGIGAVIAHEISHAFDNNGAKMDEFGNMSNWWTGEDFKAFNAKAEEMVAQWDGLPIHGKTVNGRLTVSENIADLGGVTAALEALKHEEDYDLKEFFYNWARIWAQKARLEYAQLLLTIDVHGPNELRANMPVRNLEDFHQAFEVEESDDMYMKPDDRITIW